MKLLLSTILLSYLLLFVHCQNDYCFGKDNERPQTRHFTSKTAYQIIKGTNIEKEYLVPGCKPTKIWILHRHGTRLPTVKTIKSAPKLNTLRDEIVANYRVRRTKPDTNALCLEDLSLLSMWKWNSSITVDQEQFLTMQLLGDVTTANMTVNFDHFFDFIDIFDEEFFLLRNVTFPTSINLKLFDRYFTRNLSVQPSAEKIMDFFFLNKQGYEDLKGTAKTYQRFYGDVLTKNYNNTYYKFRHTDTQRTTESFKAFAEGLFGADVKIQPDQIPEQDLLLRPYDYCESWKAHDYSGVNSENYKFKHSAIWNTTIADISRRLGFQYTLESSDIELMWDMCRYEQAWHVDRTSVWCAMFTPAQVSVFEYEDDMKYFYKLGYGFEDNTRLNCRAAQDMLTHLNSPTTPNVIAYFGHTSGVQSLLSALGIAKDDIPLTASNYNRTDYNWKTSNLDPFASNFVAVKFTCNGNVGDKVIFFLNQNAVDLDWCDVGLCDWSEVLKRYETLYTADCSSYYCADAGAASVAMTLSMLFISVIVYLLY